MEIPKMPELIQVSHVEAKELDVSTTFIPAYGRYEIAVFWDSGENKYIDCAFSKESAETIHLETIHGVLVGSITKPE